MGPCIYSSQRQQVGVIVYVIRRDEILQETTTRTLIAHAFPKNGIVKETTTSSLIGSAVHRDEIF